MSEELQGKVVAAVIRSVTAALTGTGLLGAFGSTWIGRRAYESFLHSFDVLYVPHASFPDEVFAELTTRVLLPPNLELEASFLLVVILPLLAVLAHVVYRGNLQQPAAGRLLRLYRRYYFPVTLLLTLTMTALVAAPPNATVLVVCWALLALMAVLYLVLYGSDLRQSSFTPRFVWIALALIFAVNLLVLPRVHGRHFFDLELVQMHVAGDKSSPYRYALSGRYDVLFDVDYAGGRVSVEVEIADEGINWQPLSKKKFKMRSLLEATEPPELSDEKAVDRKVENLLRQIGGTS